MAILDSLKAIFKDYVVKDESYGFSFNKLIAERKVFLSTKKLECSGKVKIDETKKEVVFTEMLKESGSGLSMDSGFGFSATSYSSGMNGRSGTIEEQSTLFGKQYKFTFNYAETRKQVEEVCGKEGYKFNYSII